MFSDSNNLPVPPKLFQTWHSKNLHPEWNKQFDIMKKNNSHITFSLFDDNDCRSFISKHFDPIVLWAFDSLNTGAYKADLWRYCVLYIEGGIYLDIKLICNDLDMLRKNDILLVKDRPTDNHIFYWNYQTYETENTANVNKSPGVWQGCLASIPKHPVFKHLIYEVVKNVIESNYGVNPICITGPFMFYQTLEKYNYSYLFRNSEWHAQFNQNPPSWYWQVSIHNNYNNPIVSEINNFRKYSSYDRKNNDALENLHYNESYFRSACFNYPKLSLYSSTIQTLQPDQYVQNIDNNYELLEKGIVYINEQVDKVKYTITINGKELINPFDSEGIKTIGIVNPVFVEPQLISWQAYSNNHPITILKLPGNSKDKHILFKKHVTLFIMNNTMCTVSSWWPNLQVDTVDDSVSFNTPDFHQYSVKPLFQIEGKYLKNTCGAHPIVIDDSNVLFLTFKETKQTGHDGKWHKYLAKYYQFVKLSMNDKTIQVSRPFSISGKYYENVISVSLVNPTSIKIIYTTPKDSACFNSMFNLTDIDWIDDAFQENIEKPIYTPLF